MLGEATTPVDGLANKLTVAPGTDAPPTVAIWTVMVTDVVPSAGTVLELAVAVELVVLRPVVAV